MTDTSPPGTDSLSPTKFCPQCGQVYGAEAVFCTADGGSLRPIAPDQDLIGTVIADRYLITAKLGEGGMGCVYRARHVRLPQDAAIKVLRPALTDDPDSIARFNREATNASAISNEHVARVYDFGETGGGMLYLAMEFVSGQSLHDLLEAESVLEPRRAASLVWQIGDGLDAAHRRGIVHRDLKPDNVIVAAHTNGVEQVKVVDFGIAKSLDRRTQMTQTGYIVGTPEFMSPEQLTGEPLDGRSDTYALALVATLMLTGELPFAGATPERAMTARLIEPPRRLAELCPQVAWPTPVQEVQDRALARDPAERYESTLEYAWAFGNAIEAWLDPDRTSGAHATARHTPPFGPFGRSPFGTPTGVTPIGSPTVPSPATVAAQPRPADVPATAVARRPSRRGWIVGGVAAAIVALAVPNARRLWSLVAAPAVPAGERALVVPSQAPSPPSIPAGGTVARPRPPAVSGRTAGVATAASTGGAKVPVTAVASPTTSPPSTRNTAAADAARHQLDSLFGKLTEDREFEADEVNAALQHLRALLPALTTSDDSVRAELTRFYGYYSLNQKEHACGLLPSLGARTMDSETRETLRALIDQCAHRPKG